MNTLPDGLQGIGIPWFEQADWERARALVHDAGLLGHSHAEYVANIERIEDQLRRNGTPFVRTPIDLDALTAWCRLAAREVNAKSCAEFAAWLAREHDHKGQRR